jgi:hypothetical protein
LRRPNPPAGTVAATAETVGGHRPPIVIALVDLPPAMTPSTVPARQGVDAGRVRPGNATPDGMQRARKVDLLAATGTASTALIRCESAISQQAGLNSYHAQ